jgi:UPF0716 protein FxsA
VLVLVVLLLAPLVELVVAIQVSEWLGGWETLALMLMVTFLGAWIVTRQGTGAWRRIRHDLAVGRVPGTALVDGALILAAGLLFLFPGFVSDALACLLLLPPVRAACRSVVGRRVRVTTAAGSTGTARRDPGRGGLDVESRVRSPEPPHGPAELEP